MPNPPDLTRALDFSMLSRTARSILGQLLGMLVGFLVVVLALPAKEPPDAKPGDRIRIGGVPVITAVACLTSLGLAMLSAHVMKSIPAGIRKRQLALKPEDDRTAMFGAYITQFCVSAALTEGAGLIALIAYLIEHQRLALFFAIASVFALAGRFPTSNRIGRWVDVQGRLVAEERMLTA